MIVAIAGIAIRMMFKRAMIFIIFVTPTIRTVNSQTMSDIDCIGTTRNDLTYPGQLGNLYPLA
eukprot:9264745-Pyramimonas_sp.AAC.1